VSEPSIALSPSMTSFFEGVVTEVVESRGVDASPGAIRYVVGLLCDFAHPDAETEGTLSQPVTFLYRDALHATGAERFRKLRALGDGVLYGAGFFGGHIEQRGVDRAYVVGVGATAYDQAASMLRRGGVAPGGPDVFGELARKFERFVELVAAVAESTLAAAARDARGGAQALRTFPAHGLHPARGRAGEPRHLPATDGQGAVLTRRKRPARSLPSEVQRRLTHFYGLDEAPDVTPFVRRAADGEREVVHVREGDDGLELAVYLPPVGEGRALTLDELCQIVEGVSHFLHLAHRARRELPTTQLELELQAEVDKYVVLAAAPTSPSAQETRAVFTRLFEEVAFLHPAGSEEGERYRFANDLAARLALRVERARGDERRLADARSLLRRFYHAGQREKIELARAA
jgi:hypothetical protein